MTGLTTRSTEPASIPQTSQTELGLFNYPECTFTTTGLLIPEGMSFDRWQLLGVDLCKAAKGIQFWIGDWIRYGEHAYGEKYAQAIEATGREYQTLANYAYVASRIDFSRRRETSVVDYSIQAEVASLPPKQQERILAKAEKEELTVKQARREVNRAKRAAGHEQSEIQVLHSPEVQEFLGNYIEALKEFEERVPLTARFLRTMIQAHAAQAHWQMERTVADDCEIIMQAVDESSAISDDDLYKWLNQRGYFMSDPELEERLEYMQSDTVRMITKTDAGEGKQEDRRGKLPEFYVRWFKKRERPKSVGADSCDEDEAA